MSVFLATLVTAAPPIHEGRDTHSAGERARAAPLRTPHLLLRIQSRSCVNCDTVTKMTVTFLAVFFQRRHLRGRHGPPRADGGAAGPVGGYDWVRDTLHPACRTHQGSPEMTRVRSHSSASSACSLLRLLLPPAESDLRHTSNHRFSCAPMPASLYYSHLLRTRYLAHVKRGPDASDRKGGADGGAVSADELTELLEQLEVSIGENQTSLGNRVSLPFIW